MKMFMIWITILYLGIASVWDLTERKIPLSVLLCGGGAEIALAVAAGVESGGWSPARILAGMIPGALLLALARIGDQAGSADGLILCAVGAVESYVFALWMLMCACLIMGGISLMGMVFRRVKKEDRLPFVPFLTAGYVICVCLRDRGL
jgi:leader peptidase (prepilin peptidase)/N-methyltransferase